MEINGYNNKGVNGKTASASQQAAQNAPVKDAAAEARQTAAAPRQDTVVLSSEARALSRLQSQVDNSAPVNRDKVEAPKTAVAKGEYQPDARRIAQKILDGGNLL